MHSSLFIVYTPALDKYYRRFSYLFLETFSLFPSIDQAYQDQLRIVTYSVGSRHFVLVNAFLINEF